MKIAETSPMNINRLSTTVERSSMAHDERASVAGREILVKKKVVYQTFSLTSHIILWRCNPGCIKEKFFLARSLSFCSSKP